MIGKQVSHYRITEKLGEGGMGVVYKADDTKLERTVALKFLPPAATESKDDRDRFTGEARAAAALHHPNICTIYEIGEENGRMFISMAYIEGETVRERIDRDGALPALEATRIAIQVAEGLAAAHEKGVVHRDIKSANVMVTPRGQAQIMDFGLADRDGQQSESGSSTLGTVAYGSPEQAKGEPTDYHTDIWSFGVTLYEMITGQLPFRGDYGSAITYSVLNENPTPPSEACEGLPEVFDRVVARCLAKSPGDRYQSADDLGGALREILHAIDPTISRVHGAAAAVDSRPWFQRLSQRNVVVSIVAYVGFALAAFALAGVASPRLMWSPHLKTVLLVGLMSLVPTVALLAARPRGRELLVIPANVIAGLALLVFVFSGKELGATTTTKIVTNEDGETIERVVPNTAYRRRFALYMFDNATGDAANDWLSYATPLLLENVIYQDPAAEVRGAFSTGAFRDLKRAGFQDWNGVPRSLKAKLAREANMQYFVEGRVVSAGDYYQIDVELVDSESGRTRYQNTFSGPDLFALSDEISDRVKSEVGIPEWHTDQITTMAASQTVTHSLEAMKEYALGEKAANLDGDWEKSIEHFRAATEADSTLALAWYSLFNSYRFSNRGEEAQAAAAHCLRHSYKLPERAQFVVKANYYYSRREPDKALTLSKMAVELYPDDSQGWAVLGRIYELRGDEVQSIAAYEHQLTLDPNDFDLLLTLGRLYENRADWAMAQEYYERYVKYNPASPRALQRLGEFYEKSGNFDAARENFEKALVVDPQQVSIAVALANVERTQGNFGDAERGYHEALAMSQTAEDRVAAYRSMEAYYDLRGQYRQSIETQRKRYAELETYLPPLVVVSSQLEGLHRYALIGQGETALERLDELAARLSPPYDKAEGFGRAGIYLALDQPEEAAKWMPMIDEYITQFRMEMIRPFYYLFEGLIADREEDHEAAIRSFEQLAALQPSEVTAQQGMGRSYRKMGQYKKALEFLNQAYARKPFDPECNYELALVYHALGKNKEANMHLERTLSIWSNAEPEYRHAAEARATAEEWESAKTM